MSNSRKQLVQEPGSQGCLVGTKTLAEVPITGLEDGEMGSLAGARTTEEMHLIQDATRIKKKEKR